MSGIGRTLGFICLCLAALLLTIAGAAAVAPPAGTLIEAQARISYLNTRLGIYESLQTNVVRVRVNPVAALDAVSDQTVYLSPDSFGQIVFFIRNTGNVALRPAITLDQQADDDYDLAGLSVVLDRNGNGFADAGEAELGPGSRTDLPLEAEQAVIVRFRTPPSLAEGARAVFRLTAVDDTASSEVTGTAIISNAGLALEKSVSLGEVEPGGTLRYYLRLRNRGMGAVPAYAEIDGHPIAIDGVPVSGILVRDAIPLNTHFSAFVSTVDFTPLYHLAGEPEQSYVTATPADPAGIDAIAFFRAGDYPRGFSADLSFEVAVSELAGGSIANAASSWISVGADLAELRSNTVHSRIAGGNGAVLIYTDPDGTAITGTALDTNVRLRLDASACNTTGGADTATIRIATDPEGDLETVTATETGPNTGIFVTALLPVQRRLPADRGDGVISGDKNTLARASAVCGGETATATLRINPGGFVFNAASNAAVAGATIIVSDAGGSEIEREVSDVDGFYTLDAVTEAGTYRIQVLPPTGLVFPSMRTFFGGWDRNVEADASYGRPFSTDGAFAGVDIPLDPKISGSIRLEKTVDQDFAGPGDILTYTLTLTNSAEQAFLSTIIHDRLPDGIIYAEGTARLDGNPVAVAGTSGGDLQFAVNAVPRKAKATLTYMARVLPFAEGRLANIAYAEGSYGYASVRSAEARAVVQVRRSGGVFSDEGVVLGKVYVDFNGNGIQDRYRDAGGAERMEPGVPGVKIHFENGAAVVTDAEGKYSVPGLSPRIHVAAVSVRTLPATAELKSTSTRDALSPQSRFIRLAPGEVAGEYFALSPKPGATPEAVLAELARRAEELAAPPGAGTDWSSIRPTYGGEGWVDYRSGSTAESRAATRATISEIIRRAKKKPAAVPSDGGAREPLSLARSRNLEAEIKTLSPELAFLDLKSDDLVVDRIVSIRVKGPAEGRLGLLLNGEPVPDSQVGQRVVFSRGGVQAAEYVAVRLTGGRNRLELALSDASGGVRERRTIDVLAPGEPARIELIAPPVASADPGSPIPVLIRLVDADGLPTFASMDVTLEGGKPGKWGADDIRATEPGLQIFIDRGQALVDYYPPSLAGSRTLAATNGLGRFETEIKFVPDDSERVIAGVVEGAVRLSRDDISTEGLDGFDATTSGLTGALYLKGKIKGGALLTLRYDSDENTEERLFRDIDPERYYPVYGDRSERGFDAQSRSHLYVKVEKGLNYILYGDIDVAPQAHEFQLGSFARAMAGAEVRLEKGPVAVSLFAGRTDQDRVVREFRAEGLSGPYDIDLAGYVEGSERVEVIARDRRQPTVVLRRTALKRYTDYRLDYFGDAILFDMPVPASDEEGNPNFIRITYELDGEGETYWVYAGEARLKLTDHLAIGYREVHSEADKVYDDRRTTRAAYAAADLGKYGRAEVELAQSVDHAGKTGYAGRAAYEVSNDHVRLRARAAHLDADFLEGTANAASGRDEAEVEAEWRVTPRLGLRTSFLYDRQRTAEDERIGGELLASWKADPALTVTGGVRHLRRLPADSDAFSVTSAVLGGEWRPASFPGFALRGEIEGDLADLSHLRGRAEASHQATSRMKLYASADLATDGSEFLDFSSSDGMAATVKAGVEYQLSEDVTSFTEARSGSETGLAGGIRGEWQRGENARVYASIEHFQPYALAGLRGSLPFAQHDADSSPETSLSAGYVAVLAGGNGRLGLGAEASFTDGGYTLYGEQEWSRRIGDWSFAVENRFAWAETDETWRLRDHLRAGAALRPAGESFDALFLGGLRFDRDLVADSGTTTVYWSAAGSLALDANTRLTAKQAGQYQKKSAGDASADSFLLLAQMGIEKDFSFKEKLRMRLGLNGPIFYDVTSGRSYAGLGGEIGFVPAPNVLVAAGYNWTDVDSGSVSEIYRTGPYLRLSMKLDDAAWGPLDRAGVTVPVGGLADRGTTGGGLADDEV